MAAAAAAPPPPAKSQVAPPPGTPPPPAAAAGAAPPPAKSQLAPPPPPGAPAAAGQANPGQNKDNEPNFQLKLEPEAKITFKGDKLTEAEVSVPVKLTNTTKTRQCFKVKTTSNDIFRVRPPLGFVAAGETTTINIVFAGKEVPGPLRHFFAFYHVGCKDDDKMPRAVWTPTVKPEGVRRVITEFLKEDGTQYGAAGNAPPPAAGAGPASPAKPAADGAAGNAPPPAVAAAAPAKPADGKSQAAPAPPPPAAAEKK